MLTREFLISIGISDNQIEKILLQIEDNKLDHFEKFLKSLFNKPESLTNSRWFPANTILDFVKNKYGHPLDNLTTNLLGRKLRKIGVKAGYRYLKKIGGTCSGYYIEVINNSDFIELKKLKDD